MTDKEKLIEVLTRTKELLSDSKNFGYYDSYDPKEMIVRIDEMLNYLDKIKPEPLSEKTIYVFGPTGAIQEISIANNWSDEYLALSARYDRLEYLLKRPVNKA